MHQMAWLVSEVETHYHVISVHAFSVRIFVPPPHSPPPRPPLVFFPVRPDSSGGGINHASIRMCRPPPHSNHGYISLITYPCSIATRFTKLFLKTNTNTNSTAAASRPHIFSPSHDARNTKIGKSPSIIRPK